MKNPLPVEYQNAIAQEEKRVLAHMQKNYGFSKKFPLIVTDKIPGKLYGITALEKRGDIKIYLNKKVMKESFDYIIENVIAHEYAHAFLFFVDKDQGPDGHGKIWQETCLNLGGRKCEKYVNAQDIVKGKLPF